MKELSEHKKITEGLDLQPEETRRLFLALTSTGDNSFITDILEAWAAKGATSSEIAVCASIMRSRALKVDAGIPNLLDIVGTGGSASKMFNISTAAALVAAGAGVAVAKHGNKAASSKTGSADALTHLGVNVISDASKAARSLNSIGICFLFAPSFHNLRPELAAARRSIGRPTLFNQVGPLANPANAPFQLIGVWDETILESMANAVFELGTERSWIVHGKDGLDELSLAKETIVYEVTSKEISRFEVSPEDFGFERKSVTGYTGLSPSESATVISSILLDRETDSPAAEIVLLNAAAAISLTGDGKDFEESSEMARASVRNGAAARVLNSLIEETNK